MTAAALTPARALRQPRRIDARAILGVLLMILTTGGAVVFWTASSDTRSVLVATRDLPAGATLGPQDLATARVRVDDAIYQATVPALDEGSLVGRQLGEPVHANQLLARAQVSARPRLGPDQVALTIATSPDTAVGGTLRSGDQVEVLLTTNKGKPDERTTVVLPRVTVYDVGFAPGVAAVGTAPADRAAVPSQVRWLTLVVDGKDQVMALAGAKWAGELDVALLPPAQSEGANGTGSQP
jgi:Flp pilus assembly protein CpaB